MLMVNQLIGFGVGGSAALTYTTLDPAKQNSTGVTLSNGNLSVARSSVSMGQVWSVLGMSSGKWYVECSIGDETEFFVGIANGAMVGANRFVGQDTNTWGYYLDGRKVTAGSYSAYGNTWAAGAVLAIIFDADTSKLYFAKDGTVQNSGDPVAGTGAAFTGLTSGPYYIACSCETVSTVNTFNFGASAFAYTPPSGFSGLGA